jgi:diacylglycerol kinase family enzyme
VDVLGRRWAAITSLLLMAAATVAAVIVGVERFPSGISVLVCVLAAATFAWWALTHRGLTRVACASLACALLIVSVTLIVLEGAVILNLLIVAAALLSIAAARRVFAVVPAELPTVVPPRRPVLFYNPKSGGGKAERFHVAREASARGVKPIEVRFSDDLAAAVRTEIDAGADAVGVAGGDGTQAIVAGVAAERGVPYVCIPAGTRNHFALDLGVDRDDVVGALDAFTKGRERLVDLAVVNGRVFVNNVSLGIYAEAVQTEGYREAKLRTIANTVPKALGPGEQPLDLQWTDADGQEHSTAAMILVSNNVYRLGRVLASGTRPRLDAGVLGITAAAGRTANHERPIAEWSAGTFEVSSAGPVAAGIDGEAVTLDPPLRFESRPQALRVLIAPQHPGASPSAQMPASPWDAVRAVGRVAIHG